ncbi:DEAD/DEAH box helicase domain-containing protein [Hydrogenispora ethanolica]|jgi:DEAD/DEAH box helicase domain-containing protein|uniref:DEAD/DEAH box helicase domain-containing protein n=1 Tax=Hydrogenispora ethanolica TaxID=1082276 RepID=A0A4R1RF67_HYDET|nr:DEAD/DEAH box helicase [Hydrogenispora ethanolica]TCL64290.1 DEAD/DEAH box helicase domain-containing protein [Hydrogenispora ethanolica]
MNVQRFLDKITADRNYQGQIVFEQQSFAKEAVWGRLDPPLSEPVQRLLAEREIKDLYSHQADAINAIRSGRHTVVVTGTASGKTLCYHLPALESYLADPQSRALFLYPTKALAQDQLKSLQRLVEGLPAPPPAMGTYDGDTPVNLRKTLRDRGNFVLTNPDMLHQGILPKHPAWSAFFTNLKYVVIDEVHTYRGVFGSNVANVMRRLIRICRHYGSMPVFIAASATIHNPLEHAQELVGLPMELVDNDGSPRGSKHFIFWNPPYLDETRTERRSANTEAAWLMTELIRERIPTITFTKARVVTELLYRYVQDQLQRYSPSLAGKIRAYRGGYLPEERREIERQLFSGELLGVASTNALELGIDIGQLDACLITGYPGTIASTWQQAGRVGRAHEESLVVYIPHQNPIDQYLVKNPQYFFERNPEAAVIDPNNPHILMGHLRCAALEGPVSGLDCQSFGAYAPALLELLGEAGELKQLQHQWYWRSNGFPPADVSLRNISDNTFSIVDVTVKPGKVIGTLEEASAYQQIYTEAIYLHDGETYFVKEMNVPQKVSYVEKIDVDYYTQSITEVQITTTAKELEREWRKAATGFGDVEVMIKPYLFRKIKFGSRDSIGFGKIDLEPQVMQTNALWVVPPPSTLHRVKEFQRDPVEAMLGIANVLTEVLPFLVMCDTGDIGSVVDLKNNGAPSIFVYDKFPGGIGFAHRSFESVEDLFHKALELIQTCSCEDGCPSCVGSPLPPNPQLDPDTTAKGRIPDKEGALIILHDLLELEPYVPKERKAPAVAGASATPVPDVPYPPLLRLPEKIEQQLRQKLAMPRRKNE